MLHRGYLWATKQKETTTPYSLNTALTSSIYHSPNSRQHTRAVGSSTCLARGRKVSRETPGPITSPPQVSTTPLPLPCTPPSHLCILLSPFSSLGSAAHRRNSLLHLSYGLWAGAPKAGEVLFSPMLIARSLENDQDFLIYCARIPTRLPAPESKDKWKGHVGEVCKQKVMV